MMLNLLKPSSWFVPTHPLIIQNRANFSRFDQSRPLAEYTFVVCDTELTGFDLKHDEIISIGAVMIRDLQIDLGTIFHQYIKPKNTKHTQATLVHRITPQQLESAPPLHEVLPRFINYCGKSILVGHFVDLDLAFLNRACKHLFGAPLHNPCVDTLRLAQIHKERFGSPYRNKIYGGHSYNLTELSHQYGLPEFIPHDALQDAVQTAYLFICLIKKFQKEGYRTLREIFRIGQDARWKL
jgi:DNA polymerase-3 subunit epsilon